jgi:hypothetical protein
VNIVGSHPQTNAMLRPIRKTSQRSWDAIPGYGPGSPPEKPERRRPLEKSDRAASPKRTFIWTPALAGNERTKTRTKQMEAILL